MNNTSGGNNVAVGYFAGLENVSGGNNTFVGYSAKPSVGNLTNATAIGAGAIVSTSNSLVLGNNANVGIGTSTPASKLSVAGLIETTTGGVKFPDGTIQTTAGGVSAGTVILNQTTLQAGANFNISGTGTSNIFNAATQFNLGGQRVLRAAAPGVGAGSLYVGINAGSSITTSTQNTFVGASAGQNTTEGDFNSFFGAGAGSNNTQGFNNSFFGSTAGAVTITGANNSFFGAGAGLSNNGDGNAFFGVAAGENNTTGGGNSFFGSNAGVYNSTGSGNTFIGNATQGNIGSTLTNITAVGASASVSQSNSMVLGSINGVNNATADTSVGIGTSAPKAKFDVTGGNILVGSPGQGIILKTPTTNLCRLLSLNDSAAIVLTTIACP